MCDMVLDLLSDEVNVRVVYTGLMARDESGFILTANTLRISNTIDELSYIATYVPMVDITVTLHFLLCIRVWLGCCYSCRFVVLLNC